jgi:hypothetical protein
MKGLITIVFFLLCIVQHGNAQFERQYISLSAGPSMIYGDNAGIYSQFEFQVQPVISLAYNRPLTNEFDLRTTFGVQMLNSGGYDPLDSYRVARWTERGQAFDFTGMAYFVDVMPTYIINPNTPGRAGEVVNFYAGLGIGVIHVQRDQQTLRDPVYVNDVFVSGRIEEEKANTTALYIPLRLGVSTNLEYDWDVSFELSALTTTSSKIDGNTFQYKSIKPELLLQFQISVIRYISR